MNLKHWALTLSILAGSLSACSASAGGGAGDVGARPAADGGVDPCVASCRVLTMCGAELAGSDMAECVTGCHQAMPPAACHACLPRDCALCDSASCWACMQTCFSAPDTPDAGMPTPPPPTETCSDDNQPDDLTRACLSGGDCSTGICGSRGLGEGAYCTRRCNSIADCPCITGMACESIDGAGPFTYCKLPPQHF
jgi:hypothetical protein